MVVGAGDPRAALSVGTAELDDALCFGVAPGGAIPLATVDTNVKNLRQDSGAEPTRCCVLAVEMVVAEPNSSLLNLSA